MVKKINKKWSEIIRILSKIEKQTKKEGNIYFLHVQAECLRREGWQQKKETLNHPPHFYGSTFFCVLFFSYCSNLSIWPGRQAVPYGKQCYTPIFDGLVSNKLRKGHSGKSIHNKDIHKCVLQKVYFSPNFLTYHWNNYIDQKPWGD